MKVSIQARSANGSFSMKKSLLSAVALTALVAFGGNAWADILIGVAGPITGPNAAFGAQLQKGAEQAAADINAAGGINGEKIVLSIGDDVSDPKQGISVANKFVADGVKYRRRSLQLGRHHPGFRSLRRERHPRDHAFGRPTRSSPSAACGTRSAPADVTTSRAPLPAAISPPTSRTPRSPSSTTRRLTARALPTRPRSR